MSPRSGVAVNWGATNAVPKLTQCPAGPQRNVSPAPMEVLRRGGATPLFAPAV